MTQYVGMFRGSASMCVLCTSEVMLCMSMCEHLTIPLHKTYGFKPHPMTSVLHFL